MVVGRLLRRRRLREMSRRVMVGRMHVLRVFVAHVGGSAILKESVIVDGWFLLSGLGWRKRRGVLTEAHPRGV